MYESQDHIVEAGLWQDGVRRSVKELTAATAAFFPNWFASRQSGNQAGTESESMDEQAENGKEISAPRPSSPLLGSTRVDVVSGCASKQ